MNPIVSALVAFFTVTSLSANPKCQQIVNNLSDEHLRLKFLACSMTKSKECKTAVCEKVATLKCIEKVHRYQLIQLIKFRKNQCYLNRVSFSGAADRVDKLSTRPHRDVVVDSIPDNVFEVAP